MSDDQATQEVEIIDAKPDTITVENVNTFAYLVGNWHKNKVARLEYMLEIPDGSQVGFDDEHLITLTGDVLTAFKIGITTALSELGVLPFLAEENDPDAEPVDVSQTELTPSA